jgi:hypothetical protein
MPLSWLRAVIHFGDIVLKNGDRNWDALLRLDVDQKCQNFVENSSIDRVKSPLDDHVPAKNVFLDYPYSTPLILTQQRIQHLQHSAVY